MKLFSADQIRKWDSHTIKNEPISSINLMERASLLLAEWIANNFEPLNKILIIIGAGNNGGDGRIIIDGVIIDNPQEHIKKLNAELTNIRKQAKKEKKTKNPEFQSIF